MNNRLTRTLAALAALALVALSALAHSTGQSAAATSRPSVSTEPRFFSECLSTKTVTLDIHELGDINAEFTCTRGLYDRLTIVNVHVVGTPGIWCRGGIKVTIGGTMKIGDKIVPFGGLSFPDDTYLEGRQEDYPHVTLHGKSFLQTATDRQPFYFGGWRWRWTDCLFHGNSLAVGAPAYLYGFIEAPSSAGQPR